MFDVFFLTMKEQGSNENFSRLKEKCNPVKIENIKGIYKAHKMASFMSNTEYFWVVDADSWIVDDFEFKHEPKEEKVHVWRSINAVNGLRYGHGAVKLFPTKVFDLPEPKVDMTTSLGGITVIDKISNENRFNVDAYSTWRAAFRECVKLASKSIENQISIATDYRLAVWCNVVTSAPYSILSIKGACAGRAYGRANAGNVDALSMINNEAWLKEQYAKI
jgi:hypothetical protein